MPSFELLLFFFFLGGGVCVCVYELDGLSWFEHVLEPVLFIVLYGIT